MNYMGKSATPFAALKEDEISGDETRHWVVAGGGEPFGKVSSPIAEDRRSWRHRPILHDGERRVGLQARDNAAARLIKLRPPTKIVIAEVKNVSRSRLDRHLLGGRDVVDVRRCHHEVQRLIGIRI